MYGGFVEIIIPDCGCTELHAENLFPVRIEIKYKKAAISTIVAPVAVFR